MVMPALVILKDFDKVRDFTMDQNGNEAYFTIQSQTEDISVISMSLRNGNEWGFQAHTRIWNPSYLPMVFGFILYPIDH